MRKVSHFSRNLFNFDKNTFQVTMLLNFKILIIVNILSKIKSNEKIKLILVHIFTKIHVSVKL